MSHSLAVRIPRRRRGVIKLKEVVNEAKIISLVHERLSFVDSAIQKMI